MTGVLVAANVLVYLLWQALGRSPAGEHWLAANFLVSAGAVAHGRVWTLVLAEFSHLEPGHLLFNMIGLWTFGRAVERAIGPGRLLGLYLVGAVVASVAYVAYAVLIGSPEPALGA